MWHLRTARGEHSSYNRYWRSSEFMSPLLLHVDRLQECSRKINLNLSVLESRRLLRRLQSVLQEQQRSRTRVRSMWVFTEAMISASFPRLQAHETDRDRFGVDEPGVHLFRQQLLEPNRRFVGARSVWINENYAHLKDFERALGPFQCLMQIRTMNGLFTWVSATNELFLLVEHKTRKIFTDVWKQSQWTQLKPSPAHRATLKFNVFILNAPMMFAFQFKNPIKRKKKCQVKQEMYW